MKRKLWLISIIIIITACTLGFLMNRNKLPAVLFSFGTAFLDGDTFAVRNYNTDNVYILQTAKNENSITLYRRMHDGNMLRYRILAQTVQTHTTDQNGWIYKSTSELPADPFSVISELVGLYKGKTTKTQAVKSYADYLLAAIVSTNHDSTLLIDYDAFASVFSDLKHLLSNAKTEKAVSFKTKSNRTQKIYTLSPFTEEEFCKQLVAITAQAINEEYRNDFCESAYVFLQTAKDIKLQVRENFFGQFAALTIFDNDVCIFSIEKLKGGM